MVFQIFLAMLLHLIVTFDIKLTVRNHNPAPLTPAYPQSSHVTTITRHSFPSSQNFWRFIALLTPSATTLSPYFFHCLFTRLPYATVFVLYILLTRHFFFFFLNAVVVMPSPTLKYILYQVRTQAKHVSFSFNIII